MQLTFERPEYKFTGINNGYTKESFYEFVNSNTILTMPREFYEDKEYIISLLKKSPAIYSYLPKEYKEMYDISKLAIELKPTIFPSLPEKFRYMKEFVLIAFTKSCPYGDTSEELQNDKEIILLSLKSSIFGNNIFNNKISEELKEQYGHYKNEFIQNLEKELSQKD